MFNSLTGVVSGKSAASLFLATAGIEWEILMPASDLHNIVEDGTAVRVPVWLCHREDSMTLYGFADELRRETFLALLKVEGIGPKAALKILGGINQSELEKALEAGDVARLSKVPGLGQKTAQKMVLALKGKLIHSGQKSTKTASPFNDLADALAGMGYEKRAAIAALEEAAAELGDENKDENLIFRKAIYILST